MKKNKGLLLKNQIMEAAHANNKEKLMDFFEHKPLKDLIPHCSKADQERFKYLS